MTALSNETRTAVEFTVDADCIARGERDNCLCCPVALAVRRRLADPLAAVVVTGIHVRINGRPYEAPPSVRVFVRHFDCRGEFAGTRDVEPFRFTLLVEDTLALLPEAPAPSHEVGYEPKAGAA